MLRMTDLKICSSESFGYNFQQWNVLQNSFNLKCLDSDMRIPKGLIQRALEELHDFAYDYHIDSEKFPYVRVTCMDEVVFQVDFHTDEDSTGPHISIYGIYYNEKKREIMQRCIGI